MTKHWGHDPYIEIREDLRKILPSGVGCAVCDPRRVRTGGDELWPEERPAIVNAMAKRSREFTAGRIMARKAMTDIGLPQVAVPIAANRAPIWPEGVVGSISHCDSLCVAVVARTRDVAAIGIDVEDYAPLEKELWGEICNPEEIAWIKSQPRAKQGRLAKQIFSTKEAIYKAIFPRILKILAFSDVTIDPDRSHATCILSQNRIVSLWADQGQDPWFSVHIPTEPTCG